MIFKRFLYNRIKTGFTYARVTQTMFAHFIKRSLGSTAKHNNETMMSNICSFNSIYILISCAPNAVSLIWRSFGCARGKKRKIVRHLHISRNSLHGISSLICVLNTNFGLNYVDIQNLTYQWQTTSYSINENCRRVSVYIYIYVALILRMSLPWCKWNIAPI